MVVAKGPSKTTGAASALGLVSLFPTPGRVARKIPVSMACSYGMIASDGVLVGSQLVEVQASTRQTKEEIPDVSLR